jgi:glycosyltransferase involved in cell wall biosynthesis
MPNKNKKLRVALVVPHIFIARGIFPHVIFSPGALALNLAKELPKHGVDVTLFTPAPADTPVKNITADMSYFNAELASRGYGAIELLKKHPATFVSLSRQIQAELISSAYEMANNGGFDLVHIYTNEEDLGLQFARFCQKPVVFTHHDPFNFLIKYKSIMPKYKTLNWISISNSQRKGMPSGTNWVANIPHGLDLSEYTPCYKPRNYVAYAGRIIEPKGVHLAIQAVKLYNTQNPNNKIVLKIAGKHYSDHEKNSYWEAKIQPELGEHIQYVGHLKGKNLKNHIAKARALLVPSTFEEPFGMVTIEALASGTPVIGLSAGATKEIIKNGETGFIIRATSEQGRISGLSQALTKINQISRPACRASAEHNFTIQKMSQSHADLYKRLTTLN